jgi:hypothetical protein
VEHIEIWASLSQLPWLKTKPLHRSQKIISMGPRGAVISIDVKRNIERKQAIMSFGNAMAVLLPSDFRREMEEIITSMQQIYDGLCLR